MSFLETNKVYSKKKNYAEKNRENDWKIKQLDKSKQENIETLQQLLSQKKIITNQ